LSKASHVGTPFGTESAFPRIGRRGGEGGRFAVFFLRVRTKRAATARQSAATTVDEGMLEIDQDGDDS